MSSYRINPEELPDEAVLFGSTAGMREVRATFERICPTELPVLIRGESGTGKEMLARHLHLRSRSAEQPFVKLNCAAMPAHLLESELLGYERGSFTGAHASKQGLVEQAEGGTLFLDEIGDMELPLQSKLLQLLQDGRYTRLGSGEERQARVRVICATNQDLEAAMERGSFREDLFYRIDGISLFLRPLRERKDDIGALTEHFREKLGRKFRCSAPPVSGTTLHLLKHWDWPGNIRELENWMTRYMVLGNDSAPGMDMASQIFLGASVKADALDKRPLKEVARAAVQATEHAVILRILQANQWNRRKTAKELKMSYRSLMYKLRDADVPSRRRTS